MQEAKETWVRFMDREHSLEEGTATHSRIFAWRILLTRGAWKAIVHRSKRVERN